MGMLNTEELVALADRAGFDITVATSPDPCDLPGQTRFPFREDADRTFSVCVAALPYNPSDRSRPFNLKTDEASYVIEQYSNLLRAAASKLSTGGVMFIYGLPAHLPRYAVALSHDLVFRYWIAVRTLTAQKEDRLRPEHTGLLLMSKPGAILNRVRVPHARCRCCGDALKDWGGKSHLMHPDGVALSDVWMDLVVDSRDQIPSEVFERILQLPAKAARARLLLVAPEQGAQESSVYVEAPAISAFDPLKQKAKKVAAARSVPRDLINRMHRATCLEVLKAIPSETVDLAFADPPFNLTKEYNGYSDDKRASDYTGWSKRWLVEYERVLKPGGAMMILNLPRWSVWLADFLSRAGGMFLQNWIVWNALPEPKGVIMPAHYSLLYFTKGPAAARFNYCSMEKGWEPFDEAVFPPDRADVCRRRQCVCKRRASGAVWRGELTDIWYDIHRSRTAMRGARKPKAHPCQTPERLVDRIIRLTTNPGDVVLDGFAGVGTTALVAERLGRRFIAIEQDGDYLHLAERRIIERRLPLKPYERAQRQGQVSKRGLQLELQRLALMLGRLPATLDVERFSRFAPEIFEAAFPSWNAALKAARLVFDSPRSALAPRADRWQQLELFRSIQSLDSLALSNRASAEVISEDSFSLIKKTDEEAKETDYRIS